eukprot:TRINITY_DN4857_c0_g1_i2.p1 TRINITY_DN4857_c0_g1~~TRINITY_DN4857_c0_g1_i2.p1  ORF type:complete len:201 (-),score=49.99 TRINITY_DN4857_c0_g1_i2:90-692(-)
MSVSARIHGGSFKPFAFANTNIPSLRDLCIQIVLKNLDALESVGDVPRELLEKILRACNPQQLLRIETCSRRKDLQTDVYWFHHCKRVYNIQGEDHKQLAKTILKENNCRTWRDYWVRMEKRENDKKRKFSEKLKNMYTNEQDAKKAKQIKVIAPPSDKRRGAASVVGLPKSRSASVPKPPPKAKLMEKTLKDMRKSSRW